jgi:hypothetical protein
MMDMSKRKRICVKKNVDDLKLEIMVDDFLIYETLVRRKIV